MSPLAKRSSRIFFARLCDEPPDDCLNAQTANATTASEKTIIDNIPNHCHPPVHPHIIAGPPFPEHLSLTQSSPLWGSGQCPSAPSRHDLRPARTVAVASDCAKEAFSNPA